MTEVEIAWLAGLLEGEGSFVSKRQVKKNKGGSEYVYVMPTIKVGSTDLDVIQRVQEMWGAKHLQFHRRRQPHWKDQWIVTRSGEPAVKTMRQILPHMGERRSAKIRELIEAWENRKAA